MDASAIIKGLDAAKAKRQIHERVWKDCFAYTYPIRASGFDGSLINAQQAQERMAALLVDATSTESARDLTANIQGGMTPANSLWFDYEIEGADQDATTWLNESARSLWANIHASNFDSESFDANLDAVVAGWAVLYVTEDEEEGGFVFDEWPLAGCYVSASKSGGRVDTIYHEYQLTVEQTVNEFGRAAVSEMVGKAYDGGKLSDQVKLVHYIYPRSNAQPGAKLARNLPFASCHIEVDSKKLVEESGYHEFPCVVPRWMLIPGSDYATGPVSDALPTIKRLNDLCRMELSAADLAVAGMWIAEDDGVLNPRTVKVGPRKIIVANSVDSMKELKSGADFNVAWTKQDEMRGQIKRMMMADQLPPADGPVKTAYEYSVRLQMLRQALGPIYGRLQSEYLRPLLERCFGLAYRASERMWAAGMPGVFIPPPESVEGKEATIKFISPLARSQRLEDVAAMDEFEMTLLNRAPVRPEDMDIYAWDEADRERAKLKGINGKLIRKPEQVDAIRKARSDAQQAAQQQEMLTPAITEAGKAAGKELATA